MRVGLEREVGFARGEPKGGGACRELHRSSWGGIVEVECPSIMHGAALKRLPPRRETFACIVAASLLPLSAGLLQTLTKRAPPTNK